MKAVTQPCGVRCCRWASLLGMARESSHATDIAELPLKASVLAKPNVIFGLDDSGSMDSEVMLNTNDGALWWDYNAAVGLGRQWQALVQLGWRCQRPVAQDGLPVPERHGAGERVYDDADNDHFAIPPTAQFAFLRSSSYNPLYYNPTVSYAPWSPAYVSGAKASYANANTAAAKSHPIYGTGTINLRGDPRH